MKTNILQITVAVMWSVFVVQDSQAQGSTFTYQGSLNDGASPANGLYEMQFTLFDRSTNGTQIGVPVSHAPVGVTNGLFAVPLSFGPNAFDGAGRWLEITVNLYGSDAVPTTLVPRQRVTASPYALHAGTAAGLYSRPFQPLELKVNGVPVLRLDAGGDAPNIIGGDANNFVLAGIAGVTIAGGGGPPRIEPWDSNYTNSVHADWGTISGGFGNTILGQVATISGGQHNTASGYNATVGGGSINHSDGSDSTVGGGSGNTASADNSTVGGGLWNGATGRYATVGGGLQNTSSVWWATVGGGRLNSSRGDSSTVGGGSGNASTGTGATVAGGGSNWSTEDGATVGGGGANGSTGRYATISGGRENLSGGLGTVVGGGELNVSSNDYATVPGGFYNLAEGYASFAAGHLAKAVHRGAFVWADVGFHSPDWIPFSSEATNEFAVRATGGVRFVTAIETNGTPTAGVSLAAGAGSWASLSDRNGKSNLAPVDSRAVLEKVAALPLAMWNYKAQDKSIRHLGPMAQDFHAAFGLGENNTTITTVDADGVALAAIQGLNQKLEQRLKAKDAEIAELRKAIDELKEFISGPSR